MHGPSVAAARALVFFEIPYPHLDPVALDLPGPVDVRWYGLGYVFGFLCGYAILRALSRRGFLRLPADAISDLIAALVVGVIAGGRLGYVFFYDFRDFAAHPLHLLRLWEGGLSFHGGLVGVVVACLWFARRHHVAWRNLADALSLGVGPGIFAVRVCNFINGELYGRVAPPSVPWAMRFPTDPVALRLMRARGGLRAKEELIGQAYRDGTWERIRAQVPLRHPSQLYEALGEGLLTGAVLWSVYLWNRRRGVRWGDGAYGGLFLLCYGAVRSVLELFRQPDEQFRDAGDALGTVLGPLTMGQVLSLCMVLAGLYFFIRGVRAQDDGGDALADDAAAGFTDRSS
ncbi:MAG TPA: prolipoprotein diacylglyceryl transferase [Longimicrobiaceae bacterium]|nr:prolipoprotein diacylglyceryl transferase [Longimicrobiaceae bacterium]